MTYKQHKSKKLKKLLKAYEEREAEIPEFARESDSEMIGIQADIDEELRKQAKEEGY